MKTMLESGNYASTYGQPEHFKWFSKRWIRTMRVGQGFWKRPEKRFIWRKCLHAWSSLRKELFHLQQSVLFLSSNIWRKTKKDIETQTAKAHDF